MQDVPHMLDPGAEPAFLKNIHHREVLWQNFREQLLEPGFASELDEMAHESCTNALTLVFVDHGEGNFSRPRSHDDISRATNDRAPFPITQFCDQSHVADEIHISEIRGPPLIPIVRDRAF